MSLTIEQQRKLYKKLCYHIATLHTDEFKNQLKTFTEQYRKDNKKGIVLLDYQNIKEVINSTKNKQFDYQWVDKKEALQIKHSGINQAILTMNARNDCVLVCSLTLDLKHLYIDCYKIILF